MEQITFEQVSKEVDKLSAIATPKASARKAIKVDKATLKKFWPAFKTIVMFVRPIVPAKWKAIMDTYVPMLELLITGTDE